MRVAVLGGHGKTGRAVCDALTTSGTEAMPLGRADWPDLAAAVDGCEAAYVIAPNLHPDEPAYVTAVLAALSVAGVARAVYHSVASPDAPAMPHHLGKARSEDLVRRSGLDWTILQPGAYLQNLDLTGPVSVPYSPDVRFGFLDLDDLGVAAAIVLTVRPLRPARPASRHPGARITAAVIDRHVQGWDMVSNPGSDRLQAPWDPDAKKKYIDTTYFWWLLPMMVVLVVLMVLFVGR